MKGKIIVSGPQVQEGIMEGIKETVDTIKTTLGPSGKCVAVVSEYGLDITRDGATVAKGINFSDPVKNLGADLIKKAATSTETQVGDSTSTTSILIHELAVKGQKAIGTGSNVNELKSGMLKAADWVKTYIASSSTPIEGDLESIKKVAAISANNDMKIGELVVECMEKVGIDGVITSDTAGDLDTTISVTAGMKIDRGWSNPHYTTTPEEGLAELENAYVMVVGEQISSVAQIMEIVGAIGQTGKPFLIVCDEMTENVNMTLISNTLQGAIRCCVVKGIDFGDSRKNSMEDLAVAVGGIHFCTENGKTVKDAKLEDLGVADKIIVSRDSTIILGGQGDKGQIDARVKVLKQRLYDPKVTEYDKSKFSKRVANLAGGIAVIHAGGASEAEKMNARATIDDSILAARSAITEGYVPGSGYVYYMASLDMEKDKAFWSTLSGDEVEGAKIVMTSLPCIMKTIATNTGHLDPALILDTVKRKKKSASPYGYNAKTKKFGYLIEEGILDSAKAIRVALENSISTAGMILLTDRVIYDEPTQEGGSQGSGLL